MAETSIVHKEGSHQTNTTGATRESGRGPLWPMSVALTLIGFVAEYVAWTMGVGAVVLTRFSHMSISSGNSGPATVEVVGGSSPAAGVQRGSTRWKAGRTADDMARPTLPSARR